MQIGVIGTCEKSCPLFLREQITKALEDLSFSECDMSFVLVSTCRRVELYFSSNDLTLTHTEILQRLREKLKSSFEHMLFSFFERECFYHLVKVTSGLDSSIIGESEVQKQIKQAYEKARKERSLKKELHFLFQKCLKIGKSLRSNFELYKRQDSLAHIILSEIKMHSKKGLEEQDLLVIGNSDINRRLLPVFFSKGIKSVTLLSKNIDVKLFQNQTNFTLKDYSMLGKLESFDSIICGTKAESYLIDRNSKIKKDQIFFDLSLPRLIDPKVRKIVHLKNIEEIGQLCQEKKKHLKAELTICEALIEKHVVKQVMLFREKTKNERLYRALALG